MHNYFLASRRTHAVEESDVIGGTIRKQEPARSLAAELVFVLQSADKPLSLGELTERLGRPFRAIAGALAAGCTAGDVDRLDGGLYVVPLRPALAELFALVNACEAQWKLDVAAKSPGALWIV